MHLNTVVSIEGEGQLGKVVCKSDAFLSEEWVVEDSLTGE